MSKAKEILEKLKDKVFMTEKGLVSFAPIIGEAIAELEALQQPKSCEECKWNDIPFPSNQFHCDECKHAYSCYNDNFEPKEQ